MLKLGGVPVWALIISLMAQVLYVLYLFSDVRRKVNLDMGRYFRNVLRPAAILVTALALCILPEVLFIQEGVLRFFVVGFTDVIVGAAVIWVACLDASEREFVTGFLKK